MLTEPGKVRTRFPRVPLVGSVALVSCLLLLPGLVVCLGPDSLLGPTAERPVGSSQVDSSTIVDTPGHSAASSRVESLGTVGSAAGAARPQLPDFYSEPAILTGRISPSNVTDGTGYYSENWGGDVYCPDLSSNACVEPGGAADVTGVQGGWIVNTVVATSSAQEMSSTWVGIGGWGTPDLIQAGTSAYLPAGGAAEYFAWWEVLPFAAVSVSLSPASAISPGDQIYVAIEYEGTTSTGQEWSFQISDVTTSSSWSDEILCGSGCTQSEFGSADFIQESPQIDGELVQIPAFTSFPIISPEYYTSNTGWAVIASGSDLDWAWQENTAFTSAATVVPSSLYGLPDLFYMDYLVDTTRDSTGCCGLATSSAEPSQSVSGTVGLASPDSFSSNAAQNLALGLALVRSGGAIEYLDASDASIGFSIGVGQNTYSTTLRVPQGTPYATYFAAFEIWYVPLGASIGSSGSLLLQTAGGPSDGPSLSVFGPSVTPPTASPASAKIDAGQNVTFSATASGGSGSYSYVWTGLPTGCTVGSEASVTCYTVPSGSSSVSIEVTDSGGATVTSSPLSYTVEADPVLATPIASPAGVDAGQTVSIAASVQGGVSPYTYTWTGLPGAGCTSTTTSPVVCTGLDEGTLTIGVSIVDSVGLSARGQELTLEINSDPEITSIAESRQSADVGQLVTFDASVSGGSGVYGYTWSQLPAGCSSVNSASLSCTPSAAGVFDVGLEVTDSNSASATSTAALQVFSAPSVSLPIASPSVVSLGQAVEFTVGASGGSGSLVYSWHNLPPGCVALNNPLIACSPTATGSWNISVTAVDSNGGSGVSSALHFTVLSPQGSTLLGLPQAEGEILIVALAAVVLTGLLIGAAIVRRGRRPPSR